MKKNFVLAGALAALLGIAALPSPTLAQSMAERLKSLEEDFIKLLILDREKNKEIEKLRHELDRLRRGDRTTGAAAHDTHKSGHGDPHKGHDDHGHHANHSDGDGSVLLETEEITVYAPALGMDVSLYQDDGETALEERLESLAGFGSGHAHTTTTTESHGIKDGANLRHAEVGLAVSLKGVGRAQVLINAGEDSVETEEAFIVSEPIADVLTVKAGLFRSAYGFSNSRHSPEWDFVNQPLSNLAILGDHGLEGLGAQVVMTPENGHMTLGLETFNADGETLFSNLAAIADRDRPGVIVGWGKGDVFRSSRSRLRLGLAAGYGFHQQSLGAHDEHEEEDHEDEDHHDSEEDRNGDGHAWFFSPGFELTNEGTGPRLDGDWSVRGEYLYRLKDLDIVGESEKYKSTQDGLYVEGLYGLAPDFQIGARFDQLGLVNTVTDEGEETGYGSSRQISLVGSYWPNDWSRLSFQLGYGDYAFEGGDDEVLHGSIRFTMQLGPHLH